MLKGEAGMSETAEVLNAKGAIARHVQWKITLQTSITLRESLSSIHLEQISHYRRCAIGRWLDSDATLAMRNHPAYQELVDRHIAFHFEMHNVAALIQNKRYTDAARAIATASVFSRSSNSLALAITAYDRVAPIAAFV
jgi:hypothetical protein